MKKRFVVVITALMLLPVITGCADAMQAMENKNMTLTAKMSEHVSLDPDMVSTNKKVCVRTTNTSGLPEINFTDLLKSKLAAKGFTVTDSTKNAYTLQANLLYMGKEKKGLTAETALAGGFGGAVPGGSVGNIYTAAMFHGDSYFGACDIQIKKPCAPVLRHITAQVQLGSSTTAEGESRDVTYRTRIVVFVKQTNIDERTVNAAIADRLAVQIAEIF